MPDTKEPLPPLTERLSSGRQGFVEFVTLVEELLRDVDVRGKSGPGPNPSVYETAFHYPPPHICAEIVNVSGLKGPVFAIPVWSERRLESDMGDFLIDRVLNRMAPKRRTGTDRQSAFAHRNVVFILPREPSREDQAWLSRWKTPPGWAVRAWGPSQLEPHFQRHKALFARYYPERARPLLDHYDGSDFRELVRRYRDRVVLAHRHVCLLGFPPEVLRERDTRAEIRLGDIFVPLRFRPEPDDANARAIELRELLVSQENPRVVILGDPGMGKSTLLAFVALFVAGASELSDVPVPSGFLPLFISLRDYARELHHRSELSFLDYLALRARSDHAIDSAHPAFFEASLRLGQAVVLLDGLDEVGNTAARHRVASAVHALCSEYPRCRFWITSRIHGYTADIALPRDAFRHVRIERLDDAQVEEFLRRWYELQLSDNPRLQAEHKESLHRAVFRTPSVRRLAGSPLLLTLMAFIHRISGNLPQDRCELYSRCVDMLLRSWQEARRAPGEAPERYPFEALGLRLHVQKEYLADLALFIQQRNQGKDGDDARGLIPRQEALDHLTIRHVSRALRARPDITDLEGREEMETFLEYLGDRTGLLVDRGGGLLSFLHLSFQEYLAAWAFLGSRDAPEPDQPTFFAEHLSAPSWEEVPLLRLYIVLHEQGGGGEPAFDAIVGAVFHLSDIHFGHPSAEHRFDQQLILDALRDDIAAYREREVPKPDVIVVTGDIAFSGIAPQYKDAEAWLRQIAGLVDLDLSHVYAVAGNHDVERAAEGGDPNIKRLVRGLRNGSDDLDEALNEPRDLALLRRRQQAYLDFASKLAHIMVASTDGKATLFWAHRIQIREGLWVRLCGLNTALLAADDHDRGHLRVGKQQLARLFTETPIEKGELVLALSHHPLQQGWLADEREVRSWVRKYAHIHLAGHVHDADSETIRAGGGGGIVQIVAGATHGDKLPPGTPASHGYSFASIVRDSQGALAVRVYPRRFSDKNRSFRVDTESVPDGEIYAEHPIGPRTA